MKTLKTLILIAIVTIANVTYANSFFETNYEVSPVLSLKNSIQRIVLDDFADSNNYFQLNGIYRFKEDVVVVFYLTPENKIRILEANSDNRISSKYVKRLLNDKKVKVDKSLINKKLKVNIRLDYRI